METGRPGIAGNAFFISYARPDKGYVVSLVEHLRAHGLPVWFDHDLELGTRWVQEIAGRIRQALAVIVIMSPASLRSEWVEREILEGQRCDRQMLPVLVDGEHFFLLAQTHFFDARDGSLPDGRVIDQLRRVHDSARAGPVGESPIVLPAAPRPAKPETLTNAESLHRLRALLSPDQPDGWLQRADIVTTSLLLDAAGRLDVGWLGRPGERALDHALVDGIDRAWADCSGGGFGFRAQLARYRTPAAGVPAGRARDFAGLAEAVGWSPDPDRPSPMYGEFTRAQRHPPGFFPTFRNPQLERSVDWHSLWVGTVMSVHLQLRQWGW
jgi:hypothetical protein